MFCTQCGTEVPDQARFCPACGAQAGGGGAMENKPATESQRPQVSNTTAPVAAKKMALWKKVVLGVVGFIVFVIGLALFATGDLQALAESHLEALRAGDIDTAYSQTSPDFRAATSLSAYQGFVRAYPVLTQHTAFSSESRSFENNAGQVIGYLTDGSNNLAKIEFQMVKIGDQWMIQGLNLDDPGE